MTTDHNITSRIRSYREYRGYSQEYMADMLDICQSAYANLESGKTSLHIDRLMKISLVLDVDIHKLIDPGNTGNSSGQSLVIENANRFHDETRQAYDALIAELKTEIEFLRGLIKERLIH